MSRYNVCTVVLFCFLFFTSAYAAREGEGNDLVNIDNVQVDSLSYVGQEGIITFDIKSSISVKNIQINVMLESTMSDEEYAKHLVLLSETETLSSDFSNETPPLEEPPAEVFLNSLDFDSEEQTSAQAPIKRPQYHLLATPIPDLVANKKVAFSQSFTVPSVVEPGTYRISISVDAGVEAGVTAIVIDDVDLASLLSLSLSEEHVLVRPDLTNLTLSYFALAGDHGYALSKTALPDDIRLNFSVSAMFKDVDKVIVSDFTLRVPNAGEYSLSIAQVDETNGGINDAIDWRLVADCAECAVLKKGETKSIELSLLIDRDAKEKIAKLSSGEIISLSVKVDPFNDISEWQNNKEDNVAILKMIVLD